MVNEKTFLEEATNEIKSKLTGKGVLACSGGQDSTLLAVIANRAAGDRVLTVFVDTGLLGRVKRKGLKAYSGGFRLITGSWTHQTGSWLNSRGSLIQSKSAKS